MHWKAHWSPIHATLEDPGRRVGDGLAKLVVFLEDAVHPGQIARDWLRGGGHTDRVTEQPEDRTQIASPPGA
eukprot:5866692-Prorocentrum_lima.AAC.1